MAKNPIKKTFVKIKLGRAATSRSNIYVAGHGILNAGEEVAVLDKLVAPGGLFSQHIASGLIEVVGVEAVVDVSAVAENIVESVVERLVEEDPTLDPTPEPEPVAEPVEAPKKRKAKNAE